MFAGPLLTRELLTAPRQARHYAARAAYVAGLFVLMYTTAQASFGWQPVRNLSELAGFGQQAFRILAVVQLCLTVFFAVLFAAGAVAQEKDRRTLLLLLMTDLRDSELVLGKLGASLLLVGVLAAAGAPVFAMVHLLGGVDPAQIAGVMAISLAAGGCAGAWGSLVAYWREKTFQTLAISVLGIVLFLGAVELTVLFAGAGSNVGAWLGMLNPFRALAAVLSPFSTHSVYGFVREAAISAGMLTALGVCLVAATVIQLRVWNPSRTVSDLMLLDENAATTTVRRHRSIWNNPVVWREICTLAYGRKIVLIKLAYLVVAAFALASAWQAPVDSPLVMGMISQTGFAFVGLGIVSLLLINAQSVTALTSERDAATLDLLLVTELSSAEFIYGKLAGILYNTKELILAPLALVAVLLVQDAITFENFVYVVLGFLTLAVFASMLGLHFGLTYESSRQAIASSLGTIFFLFIGIFICMMLIVQARSSFALQLPSFLVFILGGSLGLWASLTHRNPSPALALAAGVLPFGTFYAITSFLLGQTLGVCLLIVVAYGFTTVAMLVPAISGFDVALGRGTADQ